MLDHDFPAFVELAIQLSQDSLHERGWRFIVVYKVLEEESESFTLVGEDTCHELMFQVLRKLLIEVILFKKEASRTQDRILDVSLALIDKFLR